MDRLVSLAPSATSTLAALGVADRLVGVTHHCDRSALADPAAVERVGGWLTPDREALAALDPDLVLTADPLQADLAADLRAAGYRVFHHEPTTLDAVVAGFEGVAVAVDAAEAGDRLVASARRRIARCREMGTLEATAGGASARASSDGRPVVYCEEWDDPPMAAGNWVPDVVEAAGGRYPFRASGERSAAVEPGTVAAADPDLAVVHYCGRGAVEPPDLGARWGLDVPTYALDDALLNQPGPRLLDGLERLTALVNDVDLATVRGGAGGASG